MKSNELLQYIREIHVQHEKYAESVYGCGTRSPLTIIISCSGPDIRCGRYFISCDDSREFVCGVGWKAYLSTDGNWHKTYYGLACDFQNDPDRIQAFVWDDIDRAIATAKTCNLPRDVADQVDALTCSCI